MFEIRQLLFVALTGFTNGWDRRFQGASAFKKLQGANLAVAAPIDSLKKSEGCPEIKGAGFGPPGSEQSK